MGRRMFLNSCLLPGTVQEDTCIYMYLKDSRSNGCSEVKSMEELGLVAVDKLKVA